MISFESFHRQDSIASRKVVSETGFGGGNGGGNGEGGSAVGEGSHLLGGGADQL